MAPEQILGKPRLASDQYALGIIAYEWICGSRPFNGTAIEIAMQHSQAQPPPLREQVPTLTPAIEQVVLRALAKDPKDRFASVREFAESLTAAVEQSKPRPVPQKTKEQWASEGIAHRKAGRYKEAIEAYNRAIQLDPGYALAYNNRGAVYHDLKEYARAIEDYNRAIELNPGIANAYAGRGLVYYYLKDHKRAIQDFDYALQLDPSITWFKSQREDAYRKLGRKI